MISVFPAPPYNNLKVLLFFCFTLLTPSFISAGVFKWFFFAFPRWKEHSVIKKYPERLKGTHFQQGFSCCCYVVPFSQQWIRASRYWRLQLLSKHTGLSVWHVPLQLWWMSPSRATLCFTADYHQFQGGYWIILQRILSASQIQKKTHTHVSCQLCRMTDSPATCKCAGLDEPGSIFAVSRLVYAMPVAASLAECYSGKPLVSIYFLWG